MSHSRPMRLDETIAIAALCQAIVAKLYKLHEQNLSFRHYSRSLRALAEDRFQRQVRIEVFCSQPRAVKKR